MPLGGQHETAPLLPDQAPLTQQAQHRLDFARRHDGLVHHRGQIGWLVSIQDQQHA